MDYVGNVLRYSNVNFKEVAVKTKEKCIHYWEIEIAKGTYSKGICKNCKEEKMFVNSIATKHLAINPERADGRVGIVI